MGGSQCPQKYVTVYNGYIMAPKYTVHSTQYICVDKAAATTSFSDISVSVSAEFSPVETETSGGPSLPYYNNFWETTCTVCELLVDSPPVVANQSAFAVESAAFGTPVGPLVVATDPDSDIEVTTNNFYDVNQSRNETSQVTDSCLFDVA